MTQSYASTFFAYSIPPSRNTCDFTHLTLLPPASVDREEYTRIRFDMMMSPEEQAAREAHQEMLGGLDSVRYPDPVFDAWVHRYYAIVTTHQYLRQCRLKYLTAEENEEVEREGDDF